MQAFKYLPNMVVMYSNEVVPWQRPRNLPIRLDFLSISGGGSGRLITNAANQGGGGGGAGGYITSIIGELSGAGKPAAPPLYIYKGLQIAIVVGAGGAAGVTGSLSNNGTISGIRVPANGYYFSANSGGGGVGPTLTSMRNGGGSVNISVASLGGDATAGNGYLYPGGNAFYSATASLRSAGGGAGAGAVGGNGASGVGGNGGAGLASSITGTSVTRAGGGGGSRVANAANQGAGGSGGGGAGLYLANGNPGAVNTGSGGGGVCAGEATYISGAGGSGIVILRYPTIYPPAITTGSPTITTSGGFRIYTFTGSGSILF
jgi:hypothetical protein